MQFFFWLLIRHRAWSILKNRGTLWICIYLSENFYTFEALAWSKVSAEGFLETRSILFNMYISGSLLISVGPAKSILYFLFGNYTWFILLKILVGYNGFKVFTKSRVGRAFNRANKEKAMLGHLNQPLAAGWLAWSLRLARPWVHGAMWPSGPFKRNHYWHENHTNFIGGRD